MSKEGSGPIIDFSALDAPEAPPEFFRACALSDLRAGRPHVVRIGLRRVMLVRSGDEIHAINNVCPHAGSPLSEGRLHAGQVVCARHNWGFRIDTGACPEHPIYSLTKYEVSVRGDEIWIGIPPS
ncbi:MAG: Rieske (2Fe-2S) protein [Myxococcales bacterium]|nr:Rieske (2Fe-2S) protein [Myxococcales bacterium]